MADRRWLFVLSWMLLTLSGAAAAEVPVDLGNITEKHVLVPMRDGKRLSVYLYFPPGKGPWPVLYEQRYANLRGATTRKSYARLAAAGYVVAAQNFRGTHLSEGIWVGYRALGWGEKKDGYDTVEWLARQPWSTGKVGTLGSSQAGFAQNFLAVTRPPHLVCQYMIDTGLSLFHEGYRIGGTTRPERFKQMEAVCRNPEDNRRLLAEWFSHPTYDGYWAEEDCTRHFDRMNVPCFTVGSWFDFMCVGSIESFIGRQHRGGPNSRGNQQLLIGPWLHGRFKETSKAGEMTYPDNARFALEAHMIRWFDHHLKGIDNGAMREPTVRYYVMGAVGEKGAPGNEWRTADDWPLPAKDTSYYLYQKGRLSTGKPVEEESRTTFLADPVHPCEIPGRAFPGARDARAFEQQAEVRTFTSEVLAEPVEWTGKVRAELYVSSSARDTDFIVRVSDVYPDGRSILLMDYVRRARYREGYEKEVFLEPGKVARVAFDVGWTSQIFNRGHRIRITVASTGAPFFEPNPNTGEPLTIEPPKKTVVARNAVHHDRRYASRIIAPLRQAAQEKEQSGAGADRVRIASGVSGHIHPAACVAKDGTIVVLFGQSDMKDLRVSRSSDGGRTWSKPEPFPPTVKLSIYPGSLTALRDGRVLHAWNVWYTEPGKPKSRFVQFALSSDGGKTWGEPRSLPKNPEMQSVIRHPIVELGPKAWLFSLMDRTILYDFQTGKTTPFADGRKHGLVPMVRTVKGTLVSGAGLRSTDGGKTWEKVTPFPKVGKDGWRYDLITLDNGWLVASEVLGPGFGGDRWRFVVSRDDGKSWDFDGAITFYAPGRPIGGRACPRSAQLDRDTLGTVFYDTDGKQPGGSGVFFLRTPLKKLGPRR
jgi:uncharacterized protein